MSAQIACQGCVQSENPRVQEPCFARIICRVNQLTVTREPERLAWLQEHLKVDPTDTYNLPSNGDHVNFLSGRTQTEHPIYNHRSLTVGRLQTNNGLAVNTNYVERVRQFQEGLVFTKGSKVSSDLGRCIWQGEAGLPSEL